MIVVMSFQPSKKYGEGSSINTPSPQTQNKPVFSNQNKPNYQYKKQTTESKAPQTKSLDGIYRLIMARLPRNQVITFKDTDGGEHTINPNMVLSVHRHNNMIVIDFGVKVMTIKQDGDKITVTKTTERSG